FLMLRVAPGDPVSATVGGRLSEDALDERREALGLNRPMLVQYWEFLKNIGTLNFGQTITDNRQVIDIVQDSGGATLTLALAGFLVALAIGLPLGLRGGRLRERGAGGFPRVH